MRAWTGVAFAGRAPPAFGNSVWWLRAFEAARSPVPDKRNRSRYSGSPAAVNRLVMRRVQSKGIVSALPETECWPSAERQVPLR